MSASEHVRRHCPRSLARRGSATTEPHVHRSPRLCVSGPNAQPAAVVRRPHLVSKLRLCLLDDADELLACAPRARGAQHATAARPPPGSRSDKHFDGSTLSHAPNFMAASPRLAEEDDSGGGQRNWNINRSIPKSYVRTQKQRVCAACCCCSQVAARSTKNTASACSVVVHIQQRSGYGWPNSNHSVLAHADKCRG